MSLRKRIEKIALDAVADSSRDISTYRYQQTTFSNPTPATIKSVQGTTITVELVNGSVVDGIIAGTTTPIVGSLGVVLGGRWFGS